MPAAMHRQPEPELMDLAHEAEAYAAADFSDVNAAFVDRLLSLAWTSTARAASTWAAARATSRSGSRSSGRRGTSTASTPPNR